MKIYLRLIPFWLLLFACGSAGIDNKEKTANESVSAKDATREFDSAVWMPENNGLADTLKIDYAQNKDLLQVLQTLPDSVFVAWKWNSKDRLSFVKFISINNFILETKEDFIGIRSVKRNTIEIQVVDGKWTLSIYKANDGSYCVISDMIIGDSDYIHAFQYDNGNLIELKMESLLGDYFKELLVHRDDADCLKFLIGNAITFDYDFKEESDIKISSAYLNKDRYQNCLRSNALDLHFNAQSKKFELSKVSWLED